MVLPEVLSGEVAVFLGLVGVFRIFATNYVLFHFSGKTSFCTQREKTSGKCKAGKIFPFALWREKFSESAKGNYSFVPITTFLVFCFFTLGVFD